MSNIFSMDDPDYDKHKLFDPIVSWQTYLHMIFSIIQLPFYLLISLPLFVLFVVGLVLMPVYVGSSLLNLAFLYTRLLVRINNKVCFFLLRWEIPRIESPLPPPNSTQIQVFRHFASKRRNWNRILYFLLQPFLGIVSLSLLTLVTILALMMIYTPVSAMFGHIQIFNLYQTDSFVEAIFAFFIGFVILAGLLHAINYWFKFLKYFSISFTGR